MARNPPGQPGFRARAIIVATTLLDAEEITKSVIWGNSTVRAGTPSWICDP
jgi:hypothetical protein